VIAQPYCRAYGYKNIAPVSFQALPLFVPIDISMHPELDVTMAKKPLCNFMLNNNEKHNNSKLPNAKIC